MGDVRARLHRPVGGKQSRLEVQSARFEIGRVLALIPNSSARRINAGTSSENLQRTWENETGCLRVALVIASNSDIPSYHKSLPVALCPCVHIETRSK